jgi:hypothetical protein
MVEILEQLQRPTPAVAVVVVKITVVVKMVVQVLL